jgi:adenine-specific DNA-methyltransferase
MGTDSISLGLGEQLSKKGLTQADFDSLELLDHEDLIKLVKTLTGQGVTLSFHGKRTAKEIAKRVRPRVTRRLLEYCIGSPEQQAQNMIIEGENLQAMATLYKYRGQIDLILTDPPFNTGQQFRYNDRWDTDPNDPDLGTIVTLEDGSRHTKWMKAMLPRLQMMKEMLKPNGVVAICIDDNELFHLGMMMDEVFGEENRLGIINWQKTYSPKNQDKHLSTATEYVLVYAKDKLFTRTEKLSRTEEMDERYWNPDKDPEGNWKKQGDPTAKDPQQGAVYAIQSPFTGQLYYPPEGRHWGHTKPQMKKWLKDWGTAYIEKDIGDGKGKALLIKSIVLPLPAEANKTVIEQASKVAFQRLESGNWPQIHFGPNGMTAPNLKRYLKQVQQGKVPLTYWANEDYDEPLVLGTQSWSYEESGHSQAGVTELDSILGKGHNFQTVKPLKLFIKIIQLWCPPTGLVLDPYAGSGTTGHAALLLNKQTDSSRRFILIEQGQNGDKYARSLTQKRVMRAIAGERVDKDGNLVVTDEKLDGGFEFRVLKKQIDAATVLSMKRDELVDVVITSHWETSRRGGPTLVRIDNPRFMYLVGKNEEGEGYFIIWNGEGPVGQLDIDTYRQVLVEGKKAGLKPPYHVYARYEVYQSPNVYFYKIPDKILAHLGLNENTDSYNNSEDGEVE